jgi:RNA polymerase sigma factor (sigma-70 family)
MNHPSSDQRLSRLETLWSLVDRAHRGSAEAATEARRLVLERYGGAVRRYLQGGVRDEQAAEELLQEFALRFLRGDLRNADPRRGRFRDLLKAVLFHMIADHHKQRQRRPGPLLIELAASEGERTPLTESDEIFLASWRDELLARAWQALAEVERQTGKPVYAVLRFRADHPDLPSAQMAERLGEQLGRPLTPANARQLLHRAREKFADLLLEEVAQSLADPTPEELEEELVHIDLLEYCRPALDRRRAAP